jgi:HSP20 family molecular chaperone IbpA
MLCLSGERRPPVGFAEDGRCCVALAYGTFSESVRLPAGLDVCRIHAHLHEGVLDVHIPFASTDTSP